MSAKVVVPDRIISSAASWVPVRTNAGVTTLASAGKMYCWSQSIRLRSLPSPRNSTIGACAVGVDQPGQHDLAGAVDGLARLEGGGDGRRRVHADDVGAVDRHRARCQHAPGPVDGHDRGVGDDQRHLALRGRLRRRAGGRRAERSSAAAIEQDGDAAAADARAILAASQRTRRLHLATAGVALHVVDHPIAHDLLLSLRDKATPSDTFRQLARRLSLVLTLEATRDLETRTTTVETPLGPANGARVATEVVVVPVLRAGLGMLDAVLELLPRAKVGHIGLQRDEETAVASKYYAKFPVGLANARVLMIDPMLATGGSAVFALDLLRDAGARDIRLLCIVASPEGVKTVEAAYPGVHIYTPVVDAYLNARKFIVPGLGDFGDRLYGT